MEEEAIEENVEKVEVEGYMYFCPKCPKQIGPALTKKRIIGLAQQHIQMTHQEE